MNSYPEDIENLILRFKQLPGVGKRGAERLVSALLEWDDEDLKELGHFINIQPFLKCCIRNVICYTKIIQLNSWIR